MTEPEQTEPAESAEEGTEVEDAAAEDGDTDE